MLALTVANLKIMARNRQTTFWALFFPLILVVAFGLFDFTTAAGSDIAIINAAETPASRQLVTALSDVEILQLQEMSGDLKDGRRLIADGELDFVLAIPQGFGSAGLANRGNPPGTEGQGDSALVPVTLLLNAEDEERNQLVTGIVRRISDSAALGQLPEDLPSSVITERVAKQVVPYFDLVLLGLVGMGIMTHSIISIAVRISNYRNLSILKRMLVTPLAIWKFFAAEVVAQLLLAIIQAIVILAVGVIVFRAQINGNVLHMLPVIVLGSLVFLNIGFIISAWANSPAAASGMGNVVAFPMMFFAGTFFSTSALPWLLPYVADAMPLAPMITALRDIGLHGATAWEVWPELGWLTGWVAVTALVAIRVFRFS